MADYRDIGYFEGGEATNQLVNTQRRSQVYQVTHDGADKRLPLMKRSFISFSYGGKLIEDFGFIAITENNQIQRKVYADFNDVVTESDVFDGQIYWNTHYNANTLELSLFTDGVAEQEMDSFKRWFVPGKPRELILSEHPNRAIMARLASPPEYSILPFEQKVKLVVAGEEVETSTTCYKGRVTIEFVMDDPFWYSKANILDYYTATSETPIEPITFNFITDLQSNTGISHNCGTIWVQNVANNPSAGSTRYYLNHPGLLFLTKSFRLNTNTTYNIHLTRTYVKTSTIIFPLTMQPANYAYDHRIVCSIDLVYYDSNNSPIYRDNLVARHEQPGGVGATTQPYFSASINIPAADYNIDFSDVKYNAIKDKIVSGAIEITLVGQFSQMPTISITPQVSTITDGYQVSYWKDANDELAPIISDKDALKIILEDGVPMAVMKMSFDSTASDTDTILLGVDSVAAVDLSNAASGSRVGLDANANDTATENIGARANVGHAAYSVLTSDGMTLAATKSFDHSEALHFYYAGTAPCRPKLSFTLTPRIGAEGYICSPSNSFQSTNNKVPYDTITIESENKSEFHFTTPSIWTGYNQVIYILKTIIDVETKVLDWEEIRIALRDNVKHFAPRAYAISVLNTIAEDNKSESITVERQRDLLRDMIRTKMPSFLAGTASAGAPAVFYFDGSKNEAIGLFTYCMQSTSEALETSAKIEEDVGDMVKSDYLLIEDRNSPNPATGFLEKWSEENPAASYRIYHDLPYDLEHVNLEYKYMYL